MDFPHTVLRIWQMELHAVPLFIEGVGYFLAITAPVVALFAAIEIGWRLIERWRGIVRPRTSNCTGPK